MKTPLVVAMCLMSSWLLTSSLASADGQEKLEVPDENIQKTMTALIEEIYANEFGTATTVDARREFASRLLDDALETHDDDAGRFVLLKMSSELAAENGDMTIALKGLRRLLNEFDTDGLQIKANVYSSLANTVRDRIEQRSLAEELLTATCAAMRSDQYGLARKLAGITLISARKSRDIALVRRSAETAREIEGLEQEFTEVIKGRLVLESAPEDSTASKLVGTYLCFVNDDWDTGASILARSNDPVLVSIAQKELDAPSTAAEQVQLGDELWNCAQTYSGLKSEALRRRAVRWYEEAREELSGLTRAKVDSRLARFDVAASDVSLPDGTVLAFDFEPKSLSRRGQRLTLTDLSTGKPNATIENGKPGVGVHGSGLSLRGDGFIKFSDKALPNGDSPRTYLLWARIDELPVREVLFAVGG